MDNYIIREESKLTSLSFSTDVDKRLKKNQLPIFSSKNDKPVKHDVELKTTLKFSLSLQTNLDDVSFAIIINCHSKQIDSLDVSEYSDISTFKASYAGFYRMDNPEITDESEFKDYISKNAHEFINEDYRGLLKIIKQAYKLSDLPIRLPKQLVEVGQKLWD